MPFRTSNVGGALLAQYEQDPRILAAMQSMHQGGSMAPVATPMEGIARALQGVTGAYAMKKMQGEYGAKQADQYSAIADILAPQTVSKSAPMSVDLGNGPLDVTAPDLTVDNPNREKIMAALQSGLLTPDAVAPTVADSLGFGEKKSPKFQEVSGALYELPDAAGGAPRRVVDAPVTPKKAPQTRTFRSGNLEITQEEDGQGGWREIGRGAAWKPDAPPSVTDRAPPGYRTKADGTLEYIPGGPADPHGGAGRKAPTEDQAKNKQLYELSGKMLPQVLDNFESLANKGNQFGKAVSNLPFIGPSDAAVTSTGYQLADTGIDSIVANFLYSTSGATATPDEVKKRSATIKPKFGDSAENIAAKKQALIDMVDSIRTRATPGTAAYKYTPKPKPAAAGADPQTDALLKKYGVGGS